jgi:predicted phage terminase large subunit-like protein
MREWFKLCFVDRAPEGLQWARGYDLAVSTKENADYTASFRVALDENTGIIYIDGGFRKRIEFPEQRKYVIERMLTEKDTAHGIEKALHGEAFVQELRREPRLARVSLTPVKVATDKLTRALPLAARAEDGKVALVRGPWNDAFIDEACSFPFAQHDDQIDAVSIALRMLSKKSNGVGGF